MKTRSLFSPSLILLFSLWALISPSHSFNCSLLKLASGKKQYSNCTELPTLNSTLHFTFNATNSSLSLAFSAPFANPNGWIAWGINPTTTRMVGSQALIAFKNKGSLVVKTYNLSSYSSIVEGELSFDVWDLEAETDHDGKMVIYGSLKVPASVEKVNQVWQVGSGVINDHPMKHGFAKGNLDSLGELKLMDKVSLNASSHAPTPQVANNDEGDGWRVREINVALWILALLSVMCF
ncbi:hypothetical protein CXB51_027476 [Gossypium anomalum]|uniref:DOMON domain-containing protein n=1 Tax=Gossypium anomalum TaxID=47600 RepID=A0A8J6CS28_9ROSI|nr:hypothetical protein CXB51_027476 [Gossypium anomalum]